MKGPLDVHRALLTRDVPHEIIRLPRLVLTADDLPDALGLPSTRCVAVRLYDADGLIAVLMRAGELPDLAAVSRVLGRVGLAPAAPDSVHRVTEFAAGLVSPLLLPAEVPVLADVCLEATEVVYAATGDGGTALGIPVRSLLLESRARLGEFCVPPAGAGAPARPPATASFVPHPG